MFQSPYALLAAAYNAFHCTWMQYYYTGLWVNSLIPSTEPYVQHMGRTGWKFYPYVLHEKNDSEMDVRIFFPPPWDAKDETFNAFKLHCLHISMALEIKEITI